MNPFHNGKLIIFQTNYTHTWMPFELVPFLLIGAIGGLLGTLFIRLNIRWCEFRRSSQLKRWPVCEVLFIAFITCAISYLNVYMRYNAGEVIAELFSECSVSSNSKLCTYVYARRQLTPTRNEQEADISRACRRDTMQRID